MVDYAQAPDEQLLFVVNDHLGTPQLLMNMHEEVVWQMKKYQKKYQETK